jgi:hypothetical protein
MADWIAGFKPDTVVMESTGIYWKSPYAALEKVRVQSGYAQDCWLDYQLIIICLSTLLRGERLPG